MMSNETDESTARGDGKSGLSGTYELWDKDNPVLWLRSIVSWTLLMAIFGTSVFMTVGVMLDLGNTIGLIDLEDRPMAQGWVNQFHAMIRQPINNEP